MNTLFQTLLNLYYQPILFFAVYSVPKKADKLNLSLCFSNGDIFQLIYNIGF